MKRYLDTPNKLSIVLVKSLDWRQENEWRMVMPNLPENKDYNNPLIKICLRNIKISSIYLGLDFHKEDSHDIEERKLMLLDNFNRSKIYDIKLSEDKFKLYTD